LNVLWGYIQPRIHDGRAGNVIGWCVIGDETHPDDAKTVLNTE
jgi:hypothetical protein